MSKEEIIFNAMQRYLGTKDGANDIRFKSVDELKEHMSESPDMKLFLEVMDEYANQTEAQKLDEKVEWLYMNQESVIGYEVSTEVADYIRATHAYVAPDFYLLPSGDWVRLIEKEPDESTIKNLIEWCDKSVKEYDSASENLTSELTNYYLGKATGINDVKLFLTANKKV